MNIRVTNLSVNIIEKDLSDLFSVYGKVGFVVVSRNPLNGRSSGTAYIEMPLQAEGQQAIRALNHKQLDGNIIEVCEIEYRAGEFNN